MFEYKNKYSGNSILWWKEQKLMNEPDLPSRASSVTFGKLTSLSLIGLISDLGTIIITLCDCYKGNMKSHYNSIEFTVF